MSSNLDAMAVPNAVNKSAIKNIKTNPTITKDRSVGLKPTSIEIRKTTTPCIDATVAPPSVLPIIILYLETGATKVSFKNPNCLSRITSIPLNIAVNKILIAIIPGARN